MFQYSARRMHYGLRILLYSHMEEHTSHFAGLEPRKLQEEEVVFKILFKPDSGGNGDVW